MPRIPRVGPVDPSVVPGPPPAKEEPDGADLVADGDARGDDPVAEPTPAEVRLWASENGHEVSPHGKVPAAVVKAFKAAHEE